MRLDVVLVERGLVKSRTRARSLIESGQVSVAGEIVTRSSFDVSEAAQIQVVDDGWVSRAAHKLIGALDDAGITPRGRALDVGASTGGFTQVLLARGCQEVVAVDVGHGQFAEELRSDKRITLYEGLNVRDLTIDHVSGKPVDVVVADVSFISLTLILEQILGVLADDGFAILLVKPQFELGKKTRKAKGGIVRSDSLRKEAISGVVEAAQLLKWRVAWQKDAQLAGQDGNIEHVLILTRDGDLPKNLFGISR
ncbi:MAG: TlyA family RNA methyltransferase [Propionibacteriaceae bacterium]